MAPRVQDGAAGILKGPINGEEGPKDITMCRPHHRDCISHTHKNKQEVF